jgi:hypothetical protein
MKKFGITMPFTGIAYREIEAETEEEAIEKFLDTTSLPTMTKDTETDADVEEWAFTETIVEGNVFYGCRNEVEIEEL